MAPGAIDYDRGGDTLEAGRLVTATITLFEEQGYDEMTVAEIAERAGLTERTFLRHSRTNARRRFSGSHEPEGRCRRDPQGVAFGGWRHCLGSCGPLAQVVVALCEPRNLAWR